MNRLFFLVIFLIPALLIGQTSTYIDAKGVMRWTKKEKEVCAFGVNYSIPFSYWNYREPLVKGAYKKAIDEDVYHISRLGLDGFRIHVMESFISDEKGNLKQNIHLDLFDYLLYKLKGKGIKMYITPMYLGEGENGSFTKKYGFNVGCLSNEDAFSVQENYLKQFMNHVNPYTGITYKDEPNIIAFEVVNEPKHFKKPKLVIPYINRMIEAIKSTGCQKPLFYNMTTCIDYIGQVLDSKAEGGSFQWYPTGLTSNQEQKGNLLPNVDQYLVPFNKELKESKKPKFVYEFSPADTRGAYMYPAMARSFREAGFQFAAQFAYDPLHAAHTNVAYKTHFFNLAYTPKKALGLMIASEVFHQVPLEKSYGRYPENNQFESFNISYEEDLAEMVTDTKFYYTNDTKSIPNNRSKIEHIAGTGSSCIIKYKGTGAYFLDKIKKGVWRLELMPDAHWVKNPFFVPYTNGEVAVTVSRKHAMSIYIPDLGTEFYLEGIDTKNTYKTKANNNTVSVTPGVYLLTKKENKKHVAKKLREYHIPDRKIKQDYVLHKAPNNVSKGVPLKLYADVISDKKIEKVEIILLKNNKRVVLPMLKEANQFTYSILLPKEYTQDTQLIRYYISCKIEDEYISYPGGKKDTYLLDRRIYKNDITLDEYKPYTISVKQANSTVTLFNANTDWESIVKMNRKNKINVLPATTSDRLKIICKYPATNRQNDELVYKILCADKINNRRKDLKFKKELSILSKSLTGKNEVVKMQLLTKNGSAFSANVTITNQLKHHVVLLKELILDSYVLLPRPYPKFQNYYFKPTINKFNIEEVEAVQLTMNNQTTNSSNDKEIEFYEINLR